MPKNYTEMARAEIAREGQKPLAVLPKQPAPATNVQRGERIPTVDEQTVVDRLAAAYAKMTPEQIGKLSWTDKVLIAQGRYES